MTEGEIIRTMMEAPSPAAAMEALARRGLDLRQSFAWQDVSATIHAQAFTVAKSAGYDILNDIQAALEKALKDGQTLREFIATLQPVLENKGWWGRAMVTDPVSGERVAAQLGSPRRLKIIYDVNMRVSRAEGAWSRFETNKSRRPYLRYVAILDERTRPEHAQRHNLVLPVDHPYWNVWAPPCGWNCRCTLQNVSERDVARLIAEGEAISTTPPAGRMKIWTNKRTGETVSLPEGIDPGWGHNPGKTGLEARSGTGEGTGA